MNSSDKKLMELFSEPIEYRVEASGLIRSLNPRSRDAMVLGLNAVPVLLQRIEALRAEVEAERSENLANYSSQSNKELRNKAFHRADDVLRADERMAEGK